MQLKDVVPDVGALDIRVKDAPPLLITSRRDGDSVDIPCQEHLIAPILSNYTKIGMYVTHAGLTWRMAIRQ